MTVHQPVLLKEVLSLLVPPPDGGLFVDATLGEGGHTEAFLRAYPKLSVIGVDADPSIQAAARERLRPFGDRVRFVNSWYSDFFSAYEEPAAPDLVLMDLGVSRFHFEASGRGFSFDRDEELDMRLSPGLAMSAADIVNSFDASELIEILHSFGQERFARQIAARLVRERERAPIATASRLAAVVASAVPASHRHGRIHPATRTFQALRIAVNRELEQVEHGVAEAIRVLAPEGRIGVIAFHSLEDRIVKRIFREKSRSCTCPPEWPICAMWGQIGIAARHDQAPHRLRGGGDSQSGQPQRQAAGRAETAAGRGGAGMKRILTAALCLAVPGLFFLNAWQGFRTNTLADQVSTLEQQQRELLAANRDIIGQIAFETSPSRVAEKAAAMGLVPVDPSREVRLQARPDGAGGPAQ